MNDAAVSETEVVPEAEAVEAATTDEATEEVTEEQATSEEPSESSTENENDGDDKDNIQKRFDELTTARREAERRAAQLEAELNEARNKPDPVKLEPDKTLEDFDYDTKAYQDYVLSLATETAKAEINREAEQQARVNRYADFATKEREFADTAENYHTLTRDPTLTVTSDMVEVIQSDDKGPEVLYHLATNRDVALRLAQMPAIQMAVEVGRISAGLSMPEPSTTNAPAPAPRIEAKGEPSRISPTETASDKLSTKEWLKRRENELKAKHG